MKAYIISLRSEDSESNCKLKVALKNYGFEVFFISAIRGSELTAGYYFNQVTKYFRETGRLMAPSELGCTLSHQKAIKSFIQAKDDAAIIFEDDVILNETSLPSVTKIISSGVGKGSFIHLGGMHSKEDSMSFYPIHGEKISVQPDIYTIRASDIRHLYCTVGYIIPREHAIKLDKLIDDHAFLIDDYDYIRKRTNLKRILFSKVVKHQPPISAQSSISSERDLVLFRNLNQPSGLWKRIGEEVKKTVLWKIEQGGKLFSKKSDYIN